MKKTAVRALALVILIPVIGFWAVHWFSRSAIHMPRHFYYDTVITQSRNGQQTQDTLWHRARDFRLVNQLGDTISWKNMEGKVVVLDFFFVSCRSFCPRLSQNMYRLQQALRKSKHMVQLLSFTVDPENDDVATLKKYADKYKVQHDLWYLLTGDKKTIYDLAQDEFHVGVSEGGEKDDFVHSDRFILLDKDRTVRGYYAGQDSTMLEQLLTDISLLYVEKRQPPR